MRLKISLRTKKIPIVYHHRFVSFIKEAVKRSDPDYKKNMYKDNKPRPFTFSLVLPTIKEMKDEEIKIDENFTIKDKVFYLDGDINLFVSSSDYEFIMHLYNGLTKMKKFRFSSANDMVVNGEMIEFDVKKVSLVGDKKIKDSLVIFKTNSPVVIQDENDKAVPFLSDDFNKYINYISSKVIKTMLDRDLHQELTFRPIKLEKQVIKHTIKEFREKTGKPIMFLTGFRGIFQLAGHPEDLEYLYKVGFGSRTSQGFGMLEIVG